MSVEAKFIDVVGLSFRNGGREGVVAADNSFRYNQEDLVTFFIGDLVVGTAVGRPLMTISDLFKTKYPLHDASLINRARLLYSLAPGLGFEKPVYIDDKVRNVVSKYAKEINLDSPMLSSLDHALKKICADLNLQPKSVSHGRNHLRRATAGFRVLRDLKIPTEDGNFVLGDVYLPFSSDRKYPVLVSCTLFGKRVVASGPGLDNQTSIDLFEKYEDDWYSTSADIELHLPGRSPTMQAWTHQRGFENIAAFNTFSYVPHGYAMVKIDPRGVAETPGTRGIPGQLNKDFRDTIQWAVKQDWCTGSAAMIGSSGGANTQWNTAALKPDGLKCFVPYTGDVDMYREVAYMGGIPTTTYIGGWNARVRNASPRWKDYMDLDKIIEQQPFDNELYARMSSGTPGDDLPCFLASSQNFTIHGRGSYEAFRMRDPANTYLQLVDCDYHSWPSHNSSPKILQFLDKYLKGIHSDLEKVAIQIRLGNKLWMWRSERTWPVPGTEYVKWHLQADGTLADSPYDGPPKSFSYSNKVPLNGQKSGVSFQSAPLTTTTDLAGHFRASLSISSSIADADVVVSLWAIDEHNDVVRYSSHGRPEPICKGFLRASHRKLDVERSTPERPYHTHLQADYAPLEKNQIVDLDIEIFPCAARVRKGWRLRLDVTPQEEQPDIPGWDPIPMRKWYGETSEQAVNSVYLGNGHNNFIRCPVVPFRHGGDRQKL